MTRRAALARAAVAVWLSAAPAAAQAICSAPHSSPGFARTGAVGALPPGAGWLQLSLYGQRSTEWFDPNGDRRDFIGASVFDTRSAYLTGAYGLVRGVEVWAQLPVHRLTVRSASGRSEGRGVGDVRAAVRLSPEALGVRLPLAVRAGLKLPGAELPVDPSLLPLTEGQRDLEVSVESGWSLADGRAYVVAWAGHRWRATNQAAGIRPGAEWFAHASAGAEIGAVSLELGVDGLRGRPPIEQGVRLEGARRRLVQVVPTLGAAAGPGRIDVTAVVPVWGRSLPAGVGLSAGYRLVWGVS